MTENSETRRPRVLVTGASGFVGRFVAEHLQANGFEVHGAYRSGASIGPSSIARIAAPDFGEHFDASPLVSGMDHIVHLAGLAHATQSISEATYMTINAEAAQRFAAASRDADVKRFVFMSSVRAQIGPSAPGIITEAQSPAPTDAYGRSKIAGEQMVMDALGGSPTVSVVLRPVLVYGPGVKGNMASLMRLARSPWPLPVAGLNARRSLVSRINLASAVLHAIITPEPGAGPYLVADDEALTLAEILGALRHGLGRPPGTFRVPQMPVKLALKALGRAGDLERLTGDLCVSTEALRETGWQAAVPIREGLAAAIRDA